MRIFILVLLMSFGIFALGYFCWYRPKFFPIKNNEAYFNDKNNDTVNEAVRLKIKEPFIKNYIKHDNFNGRYCFMVDMHLPSGKNRFFVYNLQKDSVEISGLVAHGAGSDTKDSGLIFSNIPESNCTALGVYRIGKPYNGRFGLAYKLYGLDTSNSNAYKRFIVLHSYWQVPSEEVAPRGIYRSLGCIMVAPSFLQQLKPYINKTDKPIALWVFY
jgi:L,D-transpeptidase-like protein